MDILNPKISLSEISTLERYQLKEPYIAKRLNLTDPDETFHCLKKLSQRQYNFIGYLYLNKNYKKIVEIFRSIGLELNNN